MDSRRADEHCVIYLLIDRRERFAGALTKGHQPRCRAAGGRTDFLAQH